MHKTVLNYFKKLAHPGLACVMCAGKGKKSLLQRRKTALLGWSVNETFPWRTWHYNTLAWIKVRKWRNALSHCSSISGLEGFSVLFLPHFAPPKTFFTFLRIFFCLHNCIAASFYSLNNDPRGPLTPRRGAVEVELFNDATTAAAAAM
jgi:hypothetical protein